MGIPESGVTLTRVERQMGGGRVPAHIDTFGKLKASAAFNPFDRLDFLAAGVQEPRIEDYGEIGLPGGNRTAASRRRYRHTSHCAPS